MLLTSLSMVNYTEMQLIVRGSESWVNFSLNCIDMLMAEHKKCSELGKSAPSKKYTPDSGIYLSSGSVLLLIFLLGFGWIICQSIISGWLSPKMVRLSVPQKCQVICLSSYLSLNKDCYSFKILCTSLTYLHPQIGMVGPAKVLCVSWVYLHSQVGMEGPAKVLCVS